jgi:hypothetical protein
MGHSRAFAEKDTFITEYTLTANNGLNPVLETWTKYDPLKSKKDWARILIKFSLSSITAGVVNLGTLPDPREDSSVSAFINMKSVKHGESIAENFDIWALPLTASWSEGKGLDSDNFSHSGFADAVSASNTTPWTNNNGLSGGAVIQGAHNKIWDSNSGTQYFDHGEENLKIDVTNYLKQVLNGNSGDFGFMIRMSDAQEAKDGAEATAANVDTSTTGSSWYSKKFYGRETNTTGAPFLSLEWESSIKDDRAHVNFSNSANLFYYNFRNGQLTDLNGVSGGFPGHVTISANGQAITPAALTASRHSKGVYKINIGTATDEAGTSLTGINLGASAASAFVDSWTVTSVGNFVTNSFGFTPKLPDNEADRVYTISKYPVRLINLRSNYEGGSKSHIKVYIRDSSAVPTAVTGTTTAMNTFVCTDATYEIREVTTDLVEISEQSMSYDLNGNWFELDTNNLYRGVQYKIVMKLNVRGETFWYDDPDRWAFTVS